MYSLILVDYNTIDITTEYVGRCWDALGTKGAAHVVIVENGSNEGVPEMLESLYGAPQLCRVEGITQDIYCYKTADQQILYCHSGENMGYARGNNLGIWIAEAYFGDPYYVISNNDVVFDAPVDLTVADRLFETHPQIGILGPEVRTPEGEYQSPYSWMSGYQRLILFYWKPVVRLLHKIRRLFRKPAPTVRPGTGPCDWVIGCFVLARASALKQVGAFDENTFLYAEELILSRRLERAGMQTWFCPELKVIHKHAQTTQKALSALRIKDINFRSIYYYYENYTDVSAAMLCWAKINYQIHRWVYICTCKLCGLLGIRWKES